MMRGSAVLLAGLCALAAGVFPAAGVAGDWDGIPDRDALWKIVSHCLSPGPGGDYCKECPQPVPSELAQCIDTSGQDSVVICRETTELWDKTPDFVAIRDRKMCGCPPGFIHGLAIPLRRVTGIEDPAKPEGIWRFAWDSALKKVGAAGEDGVVLAVNSPAWRTQDQLHVHMARLGDSTRQRIAAGRSARVADLTEIWEVAARLALQEGLAMGGYGVTVIRDPKGGGFLVSTLVESPENVLGPLSCSGPF